MDTTAVAENIKKIVPELLRLPDHVYSSYDREADVLYVSFEHGVPADDSEMTDDDVLLRYKDGRLIGVTVLHASQRDGLTLRE